MKTQDLRGNDLDSIWTPEPFWTPHGLHIALLEGRVEIASRDRLVF